MIKIRTVEDQDLIPLSEFLPKGFPAVTQNNCLEIFDYWWSTNPAYSEEIPRGWLLEKDNAIVGFLGNIPVYVLVQGETIRAVAANNWYLDPSIRGIYSISLFNEFINQKNMSVFLFKAGKNRFYKFLSRYNFKEYVLPQFQQDYIYIIDKKRINVFTIAFILFVNLLPGLEGVSELLRRFSLLIGSWIFQKSLGQGKDAPDEMYTSSICTSCDNSFLSLRRSIPCNDELEIGYNLQTLNWLYFSKRVSSRRIVIQCTRSGDNSLAGYAVFDMFLTDQYDNRMQLMDICIENENLHVFQSLIAYATELSNQHNIKILILWAPSPTIETYLQNAVFLKRSIRHYRYVKFLNSDDIRLGKNSYQKIYSSLIWPAF
jgi:hypothetical protein